MVRKLCDLVTSTLVTLIIALAMALVGVKLFGIDVYIVLSGSMEPTYHTGSVIYVKDVDVNTLETGDVITFKLTNTVVTHRIVDVVEEDGVVKYQTKGDANDMIDGTLVTQDKVMGSPVFTIPYLGYLINFVQKPPGLYLVVAVGAILVLLILLPDLLFEDENGTEEEKL